MANDSKTPVSAAERYNVNRAVCKWLNTCALLPSRVDFEYLGETGVTVSTQQTAFKTRQYIDGSYQAQHNFYIIMRDRPATADARLSIDELMVRIAQWCEANAESLDIGDDIIIESVECSGIPQLAARYDDGSEDHQISMTLTYEVNI